MKTAVHGQEVMTGDRYTVQCRVGVGEALVAPHLGLVLDACRPGGELPVITAIKHFFALVWGALREGSDDESYVW